MINYIIGFICLAIFVFLHTWQKDADKEKLKDEIKEELKDEFNLR